MKSMQVWRHCANILLLRVIYLRCQTIVKCSINLKQQQLISFSENMPIDVVRVRDDDIPGLVMDQVVDLGIIGKNVIEEESLRRNIDPKKILYTILQRLDFGSCRLSLSIPISQKYINLKSYKFQNFQAKKS